jgi:predicted tellurium resistance membrane protein TerC
MDMMDPNVWIAFLTLTALELVLGIDNIIFISILAAKLPEADQGRARHIGLALAMFIRIGLLFAITWVIGLTAPIFTVFEQAISGRDIILIAGGLFLVAKSTHEIHEKLEGESEHGAVAAKASFVGVIIQILLLDIVFSLDSVITAVGMVDHVEIMIAAVVVSVGLMLLFAGVINDFVQRHPTVKMLALSFLLLIGVTLIAEGFDQHIPKGYVYFPIAFSLFVEMLNLRLRKSSAQPVRLHQTYESDTPPSGH